jgi:hypothetical protein
MAARGAGVVETLSSSRMRLALKLHTLHKLRKNAREA